MSERLSGPRQAWTGVLGLLSLAWRAKPAAFLLVVLLDTAGGFLPLAGAWLLKRLLDLLAAGQSAGFLGLLALQALVLVIGQTLGPLTGHLRAELGRSLALHMTARIYGKINGFAGLAYFESPRFQDTLRLAQSGAESRPLETLGTVAVLLRGGTTLVSFLAVLLITGPLLPFLLAAAVLPELLLRLRMGRQSHALAAEVGPLERRAFTLRLALSLDRFAKEIRLFALGEYLLGNLLGLQREVQTRRRRQELRELRMQLGSNVLAALTAAGAFFWVVFQALEGGISLGDVALYTAAVAGVQGALASMTAAAANLHETLLFQSHLEELMALPQPIPVARPGRPAPRLSRGLELRDVWFRYDDGLPWVLRGVDLHIPAGRCLALVGANGAGKTTLIKLLTRLYDPIRGRILWDGIDIRELDLEDLRQRTGVIFQDFSRFDLTARENIGVGRAERIHDLDAIRQAARAAGIHEAIEGLPRGYETLLNRWLSDGEPGAELSGGQWQKIAIARMLMREGELLVLDEPTAALDAQSEADVYEQFTNLVRGRTCLLITHRFTTVGMADSIAVLDQGRVAEHGPHDRLIADGGIYARLYQLQADRFTGAPRPAGT